MIAIDNFEEQYTLMKAQEKFSDCFYLLFHAHTEEELKVVYYSLMTAYRMLVNLGLFVNDMECFPAFSHRKNNVEDD